MAYSKEEIKAIGEIIFSKIAAGRSLISILDCKQLKDVNGNTYRSPDYATVMRWIATKEEFRNNYVRAREDQADYYADQIVDIADDDGLDIDIDETGKPVVKGENIQRAKLRVDARKWVASKLKPKKWGDKQQFEHSGEIKVPDIKVIISPASNDDDSE